MANSSVFLVTTPDGTDDPREGDDRIREVKAAVKERMLNAGIYWESNATPDADAGMMIPGLQGGLSGVTSTPGANDLVFFETDKATNMCKWNDSTKTMTLGTGRGGGANSYIIEAQTGNFENVDIDGTLTPTTLALTSKAIVGVYQASDVTTTVLSASYQTLPETITFTTATAAGDVLITWAGAFLITLNANTDDCTISVKFQRGGSDITNAEFAGVVVINNTAGSTVQAHKIPVCVSWLDTGASNATSTTYSVQAKAAVNGSVTANQQSSPRHVLTCSEYIFN